MTGFITNYIQNKAMGVLATGITAAGNVAGTSNPPCSRNHRFSPLAHTC